MELANRFEKLLMYLKMNPSQFSKRVGFKTPQTVREILKGNTKSVSDAVRYKIQASYPEINIEWLANGRGNMILPIEGNVTLIGKPIKEIRENLVEVNYFEVTPTATFKDFCQGMREEADRISIVPISGERIDESYCVFRISGESMAPQIQDKATVLCREIPPTRWHSLHDDVVVIAYGCKFVIKRIVKNRLDAENYLILESDNPDNPSREKVSLADIRCVFKAQRIISQQIF